MPDRGSRGSLPCATGASAAGSLLTRLSQLDRPALLLAGIDFKEAGRVEAARDAVLDPLDGEHLVARAHRRFATPGAALIVVDGEDVVKARYERTGHERFAGPCGDVPPALGGPLTAELVAD